MTIKNLIDTVKFDFNIKSTDYAQKNGSKDNGSGFLNVFESANKSYNFSFDKTEKFSYKNLEKHNENKNFNSKEFKSEYEGFYNKLDSNKNIDTPIKKRVLSETKEAVFKAKEGRKEIISEAKKAVSEAKEDRKDTVSKDKEIISEAKEAVSNVKEDRKDATAEAKEVVSEAKEDRKEAVSEINNITKTEVTENTDPNNIIIAGQNNIINANIIPNTEQQQQITSDKTAKTNVSLQNNIITEFSTDTLENNLPEELTDVQKQIANEKIINKQAENLLQKQPVEVGEENSEDQPEVAKINPEELKKTEAKINDQQIKQTQKPEILASEEVLNKLNNQIKQTQIETLKPVSEKLAETINNQDVKPVITNVEINNSSSKITSDDKNQNQKQNQQELKTNINQNQTTLPNEDNLQKIDLQKTSQFDKILNTKQTQTLENSVLNQLKDKISSDSAGKSQVNIILKPENLGKVNINLVSQNGVLTAQITAENHQVKDILNKGLEILRQNMAEQGINVGKMVVNVQEPNSLNQNMNSEQNSKNFEQANSNTSNMNYHSDKQNHSEDSTSTFSNNKLNEFDEEIETNESNILSGQSPVMSTGRVDYKV
ncbi:MAG: hypothetical protein A2039_01410 [Candidatus Melainabacteria bacterium GWA2_34_9]|nr:MAG: hypothetical protein A2039_01410 [Candidatus Melainabacteria bacterium GWA2_34_9]